MKLRILFSFPLFLFPLLSPLAHAQVPLREGFFRDDLGFSFQVRENPRVPGIALDQTIDLDPFNAPGKDHADFTEFRLIYGFGSLSLFDALGVDEVAGLTRKDAAEKIEALRAEGKTERDGAFIAGLTNVSGGKLFMFFNLTRLASSEPFAHRVLSHEPVHLARYLMSQEANPAIDYLKDPYVTLNDDNEEYYAESVERLFALAMNRYLKISNQEEP